MAQDWHEVGSEHFPGQEFANAWGLYRHAARLVVDHTFVVSIDLNPLPAGFLLDAAGDLFPTPDEAIAAAKAQLANAAAATAIVADSRSNSATALHLLLAELEEQRELADEMAGIETIFDLGLEEAPQSSGTPPDR